MFSNDAQISECCIALLRRIHHREKLWGAEGPSDYALDLLNLDGGHLSSGERVMLFACFAFWNGAAGLCFADMIAALDGENLRAVCSLAIAASEGSEAVNQWLDGQSFTKKPRPALAPGGGK